MDFRQIKLALTVELLNASTPDKPLAGARRIMDRFHKEAGTFKGLIFSAKDELNSAFERQITAMEFERYTLNLEVVTNRINQRQFLKGFSLESKHDA